MKDNTKTVRYIAAAVLHETRYGVGAFRPEPDLTWRSRYFDSERACRAWLKRARADAIKGSITKKHRIWLLVKDKFPELLD